MDSNKLLKLHRELSELEDNDPYAETAYRFPSETIARMLFSDNGVEPKMSSLYHSLLQNSPVFANKVSELREYIKRMRFTTFNEYLRYEAVVAARFERAYSVVKPVHPSLLATDVNAPFDLKGKPDDIAIEIGKPYFIAKAISEIRVSKSDKEQDRDT